MATNRRKKGNSSSSNNDDPFLSFSQSLSASSLSSSSSSKKTSSGSSSKLSEKLPSSSSSQILTKDGNLLTKFKDQIIIYYDKDNNEIKLDKNKKSYYYDDNGYFYDKNRELLNYEVIDTIDATSNKPYTIKVNVEPQSSKSFSSVSTGYDLIEKYGGRLQKFSKDNKIIYYDENDIEITPHNIDKVVYFIYDDDNNNYKYFNMNKQILNYETIDFNLKKETKLRVKRKSSSSHNFYSSLPSNILNPLKISSPKSNESIYKTIELQKSPLDNQLNPVNFRIMYVNKYSMETYIPPQNEIIYYYSTNHFYNKNKELLNYTLTKDNGIYIAYKKDENKEDIFHFKSSSFKIWTYETEYKDKNLIHFTPSDNLIIKFYDDNYKYYNYKKEELDYSVIPIRNQKDKYIARLRITEPLKIPSPPSSFQSANSQLPLPSPIPSPLPSVKKSSKTSIHTARSKSPSLFQSLKTQPSTSPFQSANSQLPSPSPLIRKRKPSPSPPIRKRSKVSNETFTPSSSSSIVSINEEKIKLCSKWAFNKRENPKRPKNPITNRNIILNGKIYNDLNKKCKKIPIMSNIISSSSEDLDSETIKTCAKWANIKEKFPDKPYNPDNKKKTPIKINGPTYNKLNKMCKKIKIHNYILLSSSKSSIIEDADTETIKKCNKWAAIKKKHPDEPYNPDNKKKTKIKIDGPTYKKLDKECRKIPIDPKYKIEDTPLNSNDKKDNIKLMKECEAFKKIQEKFKKNPNDQKLRKKIKEIKDKLIELKKKCPLLKKEKKQKEIEKIILNEDDRYLCMQWAKIKNDYPDRLYNPKTKAQINKNGPTYKKLEKKCKDFKIKDTDLHGINIANPKKNLEKKVLNKALCFEWNKKKDINPLTNRFIQKDGKTYKNIKKQCKEIIQKRKDRDYS